MRHSTILSLARLTDPDLAILDKTFQAELIVEVVQLSLQVSKHIKGWMWVGNSAGGTGGGAASSDCLNQSLMLT